MDKQFDIIMAMDTCVDLLLDCGMVKPAYGQAEQLIKGYRMELGGSLGIFACGTSKLGLRVAGSGVVGTDFYGEFVKRTLQKNGVCVDYICSEEDVQTGLGVSLCLDTHDRSILTYSGSIELVEGRHFPKELLAVSRHIHVGSYFLTKKLQSDYVEILKTAKKYNATVSVDTNWDPDENWDSGLHEVLKYTDIFLPNIHEAMAITGQTDPDPAMKMLSEMVPVVVLKEGALGARAYHNGKVIHAVSMEVQVVDTVGAGDNFDAGFIYGYLNGKSIEECLQLGCICGSYSTRYAGGIKGQLHQDELAKIYAEVYLESR